MDEVANVLAALTALTALVFALDYCRVRPWRNPGGRLVLFLAGSLAVVMGLVSARIWFGDFPCHELVRMGIYAVTLSVVVGVWVAFRRAQARARRRERDRH